MTLPRWNIHRAIFYEAVQLVGRIHAVVKVSHSYPLFAKIGGRNGPTTRSDGSPALYQLQFPFGWGRNTKVEHDAVMCVVALTRLR